MVLSCDKSVINMYLFVYLLIIPGTLCVGGKKTNRKLGDYRQYYKYDLLKATPTRINQVLYLRSILDNSSMGIDFWIPPSIPNKEAHLLVPPEVKTLLMDKARDLGMNIEVLLENVQNEFDSQKGGHQYNRRMMDSFNWTSYYNLESINSWMHDLTMKYSDRMHLMNMGSTYEGRSILGIHVHSTVHNGETIFVEGGIHGREWIGISVVTYLIDKIVTLKDVEPSVVKLIQRYNWHLFPCVNPDGYVYTHTHDRLWLKNRHPYKGGVGVDLNKNFRYKFNTMGVSHIPSKDTFCGPNPFSEPETKAMFRYISKLAEYRLTHYLSMHSYGQLIVLPFGDNIGKAGNYEDVEFLAAKAVEKVKIVYDSEYLIGTASSLMGFLVSGTSLDWVKDAFNVRFVVGIELRDLGKYGFALPAVQILPTCKETFLFITEILKQESYDRSTSPTSPHITSALPVFVNESLTTMLPSETMITESFSILAGPGVNETENVEILRAKSCRFEVPWVVIVLMKVLEL